MSDFKKSEMSELIPNEAGLPCNEQDSEKVKKGLRQWKAIRKEKIEPKDASMTYWQKQSSFPAL